MVRRPADADRLRELGAKVAIGDAANPEFLQAVLRDAHTLCHVVDGLFVDEEKYFPVIAGGTQATVQAASEAGLARVLLLSYPGADAGSPNAYLRAKGIAEQAVRDSGLQHVIMRSTLVVGSDVRWLRALGRGGHRLAPAFVDDVAAVFAAADDRAQPVSGTFGLQGLDRVTADELVRLLGREGRRTALRRGPRISRTAAEILASDSLADAPDAAAEFGVKLTPLREALVASGFIVT
jgi:uncharacterized protein YbjT (DUF2867 family)